jgi:stage V sporulation protein R
MGGDDGPMNPYKLGIELYRHALVQHPGPRPEAMARLFELRAVHNDLTFVDNVLDEEFCRRHGLGQDAAECAAAREQFLTALTNGGQPVIRRVEGAAGELELEHVWSGSELQMEQAEETLRSLRALWKAPVRLRTRLENRAVLLTCGADGVTREYGELVADPAGRGKV